MTWNLTNTQFRLLRDFLCGVDLNSLDSPERKGDASSDPENLSSTEEDCGFGLNASEL